MLLLLLLQQQPNCFKLLSKDPLGLSSKQGVSSEPPAKRSQAQPVTTTESAKKQTLAVSRELLLQLFIELDKMDGTVLKKAVSTIRNQLETAREQEVKVIGADSPNTNFVVNTATSKVASLQAAANVVVAASVARPTLAGNSPKPTGTSTEEVVAPSPVKQKMSNPSLI